MGGHFTCRQTLPPLDKGQVYHYNITRDNVLLQVGDYHLSISFKTFLDAQQEYPRVRDRTKQWTL